MEKVGKIFLSGKPGVGKSTLLKQILEELRREGFKVGGIVTPEVRKGGKRVGFKVVDVYSGREAWLAKVGVYPNAVRFGKYSVFVHEFERVALPALDFALRECEVIAVDEIGKMEFLSRRFKEKIFEILKSERFLVAVLHRNFLHSFRSFGEVVEVRKENRERVREEVIKEILGFLHREKSSKKV